MFYLNSSFNECFFVRNILFKYLSVCLKGECDVN
jgi:hypothetical protein